MNNIHPSKDGFIFSGNQQESVPRALFLDRRLTPLERNAWQVIRMMLESDGVTALPTYEQLRCYLSNVPYADKASFETVARALTILRLARWLSLIKKRRARDGSIQSNLYVLHDEPLTPFEAMRLDEDYFSLVCQSMNHASKAIQHVAAGVLEDISNDPFLTGKRLPTRLEVLLGRMENTSIAEEKLSTAHQSEESKNSLLRNQELLTSESEAGLERPKIGSLRNPKSVVCSNSSNVNILRQESTQHLNLPQRFYHLTEGQQKNILKMIERLIPEMQRQVFNEWNERCQKQAVRKPVAYLYGIVQKALQGEFNSSIEPLVQSKSIGTSPASVSTISPGTEYKPTPEEREQIRQHIEHIKTMMSHGRRS